MAEKKQCNYTSIGGSALIEGVMMRGTDKLAIACRRADGAIQMKIEPLDTKKKWYAKVPILRGILAFISSLTVSYKCLMYSADVSMEGIEEPENPGKLDQFLEKLMGKTGMAILGGVSMVLGLALSLFLFMYLPTLFTSWAMFWAPAPLKAVAEGLLKILIFLGYLLSVSLMPDMRRTFQYHGGEHKSIFCFEGGKELIAENAMKCKRLHPRCGTSFMFFTLLISIVFAMFIPWGNRLVRTFLKMLFVPIVMGIAYEFIRYAGKHDNWFTRIISAPGQWFQLITTKEPDEKQINVALCALKGVLNEYPINTEFFVDENGTFIKEKENGNDQIETEGSATAG